MARKAKHENALVLAAATLFRKQGYAATGTAEILSLSGAPRGSLYHYFPGGKEEIAAAAVVAAGKTLSITFNKVIAETDSAAEFVLAYGDMLAGWMKQSDFRDGNPITTIILETVPQSEKITLEAERTLRICCDHIAALLTRENWQEDRIAATAELILSAFDGALVVARVKQNADPILNTAKELALFLAK
ncbi:MAG: TetR/AcrR family transcriptional regulator [Kordiimonadaceae bacterium]|nr:TetR/AcrR family transcriptional regulator [Kordiimonadaceae bacterium]